MAEKKDRWILKNLVAAAIYLVVLLGITTVGLNLITNHGKMTEVER